MPQTWNYDVDLPGGMSHSIQVQSDSEDADFNLYVIDSTGKTVAKDTGPEAGANCELTTAEDGSYVLRIELVKGHCGFSMNVSSKTSAASATEPESSAAPTDEVSALTPAEVQGLLEAHNQWRAKYGCAPLEWCDKCASVAQDWANTLKDDMQMKHRSPNELGENIYWCAGKSATAQEVVDAWGGEVEFYDEAENNWWPKAGHFSQVVWASTTHVGGGVVRKDGQEIWVCNYTPRGNWNGERPYPIA